MMMRKLTAACGASVLIATAQAGPQYASIEVGEGLTLTPALEVMFEYDDNIFQTERNKKDSLRTTVSPALEFVSQMEAGTLSAGYAGSYGFYSNSSDDNFDNHALLVVLDLSGSRSGFGAYVGYDWMSDPRGTGPSDGIGENLLRTVFDAPTKFEELSYGANFSLGGSGQRTRVDFSYDGMEKTYQNFRDITRARDHRRDSFGIGVDYQLTGKTSAVINAGRSYVDYDFTPPGAAKLDSEEDRLTAGLRWEATARTTGTVQFGWQWKDFDDPTRADADSFTWDVSIAWAPRTYSVFTLSSGRNFSETDNFGSAKDVSTAGLDWTHSWSDRLSTSTGIEYARENYKGFDREDDFYQFMLGFDYDFRRWMSLGGGVRLSSRDSSLDRADFDRNVVFLRAQMSL